MESYGIQMFYRLIVRMLCFARKFYSEGTDIATCHPLRHYMLAGIFLIIQFRSRDAAA